MFIETSSEGRDLSAVRDILWKRHYEKHFGVENANVVIRRMKKVQHSYKWRDLYKAKLKERDGAQKKSVDRMKELYVQEVMTYEPKLFNMDDCLFGVISCEKQSRQIRICTKIPPSKKRSYFEGSGSCNNFSSVKGNLMKKAKLEYLNSHEAKVHAAMRKNASRRQNTTPSSVSQKARPGSFSERGAYSSSSSSYKTAVQPSIKRRWQ